MFRLILSNFSYIYRPLNNMLDWPAHLPLTMDTSVENMTQRIFSELGSHCSHHGGGVTSPAHMGRIKKAFEKVPGRELKVIHRGYHGGKAHGQCVSVCV